MTKNISVTADGGMSGSLQLGWVCYIHTEADSNPMQISSFTRDSGQMFPDQSDITG